MELDAIAARRVVRYLKRGVFPPDAIGWLTAGRAAETNHIIDALQEVQQGSNRHCFVEANYGVGKSHFLKLVESLALQQQFAVSWVTINGADHAFNHPTRYLHSILGNVRVLDFEVRGLAALCRLWLKNGQREALLNWASKHASWQTRNALMRLAEYEEEEQYERAEHTNFALEGRDLQHKNGAVHFPEFFKRLENTISLFLAVGYHGVVFLFDEIECIATHLANHRSRLLSYQLANTLTDARRFGSAMFVFATTEDFGEKVSSDRNVYSYLNKEYQDGCRFAEKWHAGEMNVLSIGHISEKDNRRCLARIREVHGRAYGWNPEGQVSDEFIDSYMETATRTHHAQRTIIKWFVDILEISQQNPLCVPQM